MACTTILIGKDASYDGSTMIARNSDSSAGSFTPKRFTIIPAQKEAYTYTSTLSHVKIDLPANGMQYTSTPNVLLNEGIWAGSGVNSANVGMTATETITSNERVQGADPLVVYHPSICGSPEEPGGIGEEDMVTLVLPYIHSAREGVERLGQLLEQYGTYEMNAIAFQDVNEIWWLESIGGHHWIAKKVPDDSYVVMPNQLGIDAFDLEDAYGAKKEYMCCADLKNFIETYHLDLTLNGLLNPRDAFGSHSEIDHIYNTPRAWYMERFLNPTDTFYDGPGADYTPASDNIPWSRVPERRVTVEDVKYILSSYYQGTPFDPYRQDPHRPHEMFRPIGINRTDFMSLIQIRPYMPENFRCLEWVTFGSNAFNAMIPFYTNLTSAPSYLENTGARASTDDFYWTSRIIAALADAAYTPTRNAIEHYQASVQSKAWELIHRYDEKLKKLPADQCEAVFNQAGQDASDMLQQETNDALDQVLYIASCHMKNAFSLSDH